MQLKEIAKINSSYLGKCLLVCIIVLFSTVGYSQELNLNLDSSDKGKLYVYFGWNRGWFTQSDIHFSGDHYDFTLMNVSAADRPSKFSAKLYFSPKTLSIPQFNSRIGYYFKDNWDLSLGVDHMKYVVEQNQEVLISGYIEDVNATYDNIYENEFIELKKDFLLFEHSDGLNYLNAELRHSRNLFVRSKFKISSREGIGLGGVMPRTNATLLGKQRHDEFHLSGYGGSLLLGLNFSFFETFFIQSEFKGGFINLPEIRTTNSKSDQASQHFFFTQLNLVFGANIRLVRKKKD